MENELITLIGLGAVGAPLAHLLERKYGDRFALLSSPNYVRFLKNVSINDVDFSPTVITKKEELNRRIGVVFICVKNYQIEEVAKLLGDLIDDETILFPLQNGLYSHDYFKKTFPHNIVLEGFAQGPNTKIVNRSYTYQKPGVFHVGSSNLKWIDETRIVYESMIDAGVNAVFDEHIKEAVWKKLMLNVAGNAITALTEIDYCMFVNSPEAQGLCRKAMKEFKTIAVSQGVNITDDDIENVINYYLSFRVSKRTSMLEDVLNKRKTENEYIAGYVSNLATKLGIKTPYIDMLYYLIRIKEQVYLKQL